MCHFNVLSHSFFMSVFFIFTSKTQYGMRPALYTAYSNSKCWILHIMGKEMERRLHCLAVVEQINWLHVPAPCKHPYALQRQNAENLKQIFPEKEYRGLNPNFHIHVSVSEVYIPTMGLPVLLEEICRLILGIYKSLKDT
jgi:hypothetical protein